jgi:Zn-finger nucleic acid-binding protein
MPEGEDPAAMALCPRCGNEVEDALHCSVCDAGRGGRKTRVRAAAGACRCPRCDGALVEQDWEGTKTLTCGECRGTFFPGVSLETVLNHLRATCDPKNVESVLKDFKDRFTRELPDAVRYKKCPVCDTVMLRKNYATVSGVIVDHCSDHGTWVDETAFAGLADFICRGGDLLANEADKVRARNDLRREGDGGSSLLGKLFGGQ